MSGTRIQGGMSEIFEMYQPHTLAQSELKNDGPYLVYGANGVIGKHTSYNHEEAQVLVTCRGATCGAINVSAPFSWINGNAMVIKPRENNVDLAFLKYYLESGIDIKKVITGAAQPQITRQSLSLLKVDLPPLAEQQRIASILDKTELLYRKRKLAIQKLDELAKSVYVEMFEHKKKYEHKKLNEVCELITDGTHYTPTYADEGVIFLSAKNVTSGKIDWDKIKHIPHSLHLELEKRVKPKIGDVLLAKNGTTGVAAIVDRESVFDIYVSLALLRPKDMILSGFLHAALNSLNTKRQFNSALKGIGVPNLHLVDIRNTTIPLPNMEEQQKFIEITDKINKMREITSRSFENKMNLISSLQNQVF